MKTLRQEVKEWILYYSNIFKGIENIPEISIEEIEKFLIKDGFNAKNIEKEIHLFFKLNN